MTSGEGPSPDGPEAPGLPRRAKVLLPVLIFVIAMSDSIHVIARYRRELAAGEPQPRAVFPTVQHLAAARSLPRRPGQTVYYVHISICAPLWYRKSSSRQSRWQESGRASGEDLYMHSAPSLAGQ